MQTAKSSEEKMARVAETNSGKERTARKKGSEERIGRKGRHFL